jgi:hypothetical protein
MTIPHMFSILGAAGAGGVPTLAEAILALSPVGYWKLDDDSSGGDFEDYSTNNDNAGSIGVTFQGKAGVGGSYVEFDGTNNDGVLMTDESYYSPSTSGLTMFCLIYPDSVTGARIIASKHTQPPAEYQFFTNGQRLQITLWPGSTASNMQTQQSNSDIITTADWQAVAITTADRTAGTNPKLFRNSGTAVASSVVGSVSGTWSDSAAPLRLGRRADTAGYFDGGIAHFAIWDFALADSDIQDIMDAATNEGWI